MFIFFFRIIQIYAQSPDAGGPGITVVDSDPRDPVCGAREIEASLTSLPVVAYSVSQERPPVLRQIR